ncbi:MAG: DUF151 domain-containing protein [Acidilobaceae archaeon]
MKRDEESRLVKVTEVVVSWKQFRDPYTGYSGYILGLDLILEDGRVFNMVNIPSDVAEAIRALKGETSIPRRQSFFTLVLSHEPFRDALSQHIESIVVDELDKSTGLYSASVKFREDNATISIKMIPSHAVFLALLTNKPIFVLEDLIEDSSLNLQEE